MSKFVFVPVLCFFVILFGCSVEQKESNALKAPDCLEQMLGMKILPFKGYKELDEKYDFFAENVGNQEIRQCLIENITNLTQMDDPRQTPISYDFRVGDLSLFMLREFHGLKINEVYPDEVLQSSEIIGIYAYFEYVSENEGGRALIQNNVKRFYTEMPK